MAFEYLSTILPKDDSHDAGEWDRDTWSNAISGRSSGWNLRRRSREYEMHPPDNYYFTRYSSNCQSWHAEAIERLGNILPQISLQIDKIWPALQDDETISCYRSIRWIILPVQKVEWNGINIIWACDYYSCRGDTFKPFGTAMDSIQQSPVVRQEVRPFSPSGTVLVQYRSHE